VAGVLLSAAWLVPLLGHALGGEDPGASSDATGEGLVLGVLVVAAMAATAGAFRHERQGGLALVAIGVALAGFAVVTAGRNHWLAVLVASVPWILVGVLFVASARRPSADPG
jgi:hypothetical protein